MNTHILYVCWHNNFIAWDLRRLLIAVDKLIIEDRNWVWSEFVFLEWSAQSHCSMSYSYS